MRSEDDCDEDEDDKDEDEDEDEDEEICSLLLEETTTDDIELFDIEFPLSPPHPPNIKHMATPVLYK